MLPIGGLKEKLLAAHRGGIKTVLIPEENEKDLAEIPDNVTKGLKIIPVTTVDEVLKIALTRPLVPVEWHEEEDPVTPPKPAGGRRPRRSDHALSARQSELRIGPALPALFVCAARFPTRDAPPSSQADFRRSVLRQARDEGMSKG